MPRRGFTLVLLGFLAFAAAHAQGEDPTWLTPLPPIVFFPPTPPVYGAEIENKPEGRLDFYRGQRMVPPDGMGDFVGESFYPALSTRLFALDLSRSFETRIENYRGKRRRQVNALMNFFVTLHDVSAEERRVRLRVFAEQQTPELVALEADGEQLREDLVASGLWNRVDWNYERRWKLGTAPGRANAVDMEAEYQVMRAAAFYEKGFVAAQRGLLREIAMELRPVARKARGLPVARGDSDAMFFSPETSRFRLPPNLPAALREKIGAYNGRKIQLKQELREAVFQHDQSSASKRTAAFTALAESQWPALVSLEQLAEEIREGLAELFEPAQPPPPPWLPSGLMETIRSYNADREIFFAEMKIAADRAAKNVPPPDTATDSEADARLQRRAEYAERRAAAHRQAMQDFHKENEARYNTLLERYKTIREMLAIVADKQKDPKTGRPLDADTLLKQHVAAMREFETFGRETTIYTNYRLAMMQPGLSPEQRRLLFSDTLVAMAQPLPYGEVMPRKTSKTPHPTW